MKKGIIIGMALLLSTQMVPVAGASCFQYYTDDYEAYSRCIEQENRLNDLEQRQRDLEYEMDRREREQMYMDRPSINDFYEDEEPSLYDW